MLRALTFVFFCFAVLQQLTAQTSRPQVSDHYWREYNGVVPHDAVPGGFDKAGEKTYIGQAFQKAYGLIPVTITPGSDKTSSTVIGGWVLNSEGYLKILCSKTIDKYNWIPVKIEDLQLLGTRCHLVVGGTEATNVLHIGRAYHEMETIVGKVFLAHSGNKGLAIAYNKKEVRYNAFDILTYNCNIKSQYTFSANDTIV